MPPSVYETSDVYLASYLLCQGASLVETERVSPRRTVFRFTSDEYTHCLLRVYWSNARIPIPPTLLFDALRRLRSRIRRKPAATDHGAECGADAGPPSTSGSGEPTTSNTPTGPC